MKSALQNMSQSKLINRVYVYRTVRSGKVKMKYLFWSYFFYFSSFLFFLFFKFFSIRYYTQEQRKSKINWNEELAATLRLPNLVSLKKVGKAPL